MTESPAFLADRLRVEGEKTTTFFANLKPGQWECKVYTEGDTWTVRSVLAHYITAERGFIKIFSGIRDGELGVPDDFDIDRYNASQQKKSKDLSPTELLGQFGSIRQQMIELVASFSALDLEKQGRHPFLGQTTLVEMIKLVYRHNQVHIRDLRKVIC